MSTPSLCSLRPIGNEYGCDRIGRQHVRSRTTVAAQRLCHYDSEPNNGGGVAGF